MRISELDNKSFLGAAGAAENSYVVVNYKDSTTDRPATYKATLAELGKMLIENLHLVKYDTTNGKMLDTLAASNGAYSTTNVGQFINADDRTKLDHAVTDSDNLAKADVATTVTNVEYSGTNKEITQTINSTTTRVVSLAKLKTDMALDNVENKSSATIRSELTNSDVTTGLGYTPINTAARGAANGVASLDQDGLIPAAQLPSYVDDVIEVADFDHMPSTGEANKIYVTLDTNLTYRWTGSAFIEISKSLALGETSSTAYAGDKGALAYAHSVTNKGVEVALSTESEDPETHETITTKSPKFVKVQTNGEGHIINSAAVTKQDLLDLGVVEAISGKQLSTEDYTTAEQTKLAGIAAGAEVNVQADWSVSDNTSDAYIANKPTLGTAAALDVPASGNAGNGEVVLGSDSRLSDSRNAADVYSWAKASTKPTYTATEVGVPEWAQVATAPYYTKPVTGIPASDIETGVIPDVSGFYTKPVGGIPSTDLADTYLTSSDISGLASTTAPTFTTSITIGNTTLTEADLIALKSILPLPDTDGEYTLVRSTESDVTTYTWTAQA